MTNNPYDKIAPACTDETQRDDPLLFVGIVVACLVSALCWIAIFVFVGWLRS